MDRLKFLAVWPRALTVEEIIRLHNQEPVEEPSYCYYGLGIEPWDFVWGLITWIVYEIRLLFE